MQGWIFCRIPKDCLLATFRSVDCFGKSFPILSSPHDVWNLGKVFHSGMVPNYKMLLNCRILPNWKTLNCKLLLNWKMLPCSNPSQMGNASQLGNAFQAENAYKLVSTSQWEMLLRLEMLNKSSKLGNTFQLGNTSHFLNFSKQEEQPHWETHSSQESSPSL